MDCRLRWRSCSARGPRHGKVTMTRARLKPYTLPDPLTCVSGKKVVKAEEWRKSRRPEVLRLFEENVGWTDTLDEDEDALPRRLY